MLRVHFLNHASVLIDLGEVRLLTDPWYWGDCFLGGWGLKYENPKVWELAATATHLWVSHFHADHFHPPTLKRLLEVNPDLIALGNDSYNFQLDQALKGLGFAHVIPFQERKAYALTPEIKLTRYPTTGIDNALWIESPQGTILNYNDCNLPPLSRTWLGKRLGNIDLLLTNFNHAGKLLTFPPKSAESVKKSLREAFSHNYESFAVKHIFPFASYHYYRAPESQDQNASLLSLEELLDIDDRIVPIQIGEELHLDAQRGTVEIQAGERKDAPQTVLQRAKGQDWETLQIAGNQYAKRLRQNYGWFTRLLPRFVIEVEDLDLVTELHPRRGLTQLPA
ncbi:MAG: MBL fold metallo-hydrolase, partial [Bacteroidota bacterium]